MSLQTFREALGSRLGKVITPELAAWLEDNAFDRLDKSYEPTLFAKQTYQGLVFRAERFRDIEAEIHPLHMEQWLETEQHRADKPLNPNYPALHDLERAGKLMQFTARNADGKLVGNIRMYLYNDLHTKTRGAKEDTMYLLPEVRKGFTAIRFWQYMETCLQAIGCFDIYTDSKVLHDADGKITRNVGKLNEYLGYKHVSNGFYRHLGENHV